MDFMQILTMAGQFAFVTAIAFVIFVLIASHIRFQRLARIAVTAPEEGMDPHDAFQVTIAHALGTAHRAPDPFSVVIASVHDWAAVASRHDAGTAAELLALFCARLKGCVRAADTVMPIAGDRVGIVLRAPGGKSEPVARRLIDAIAAAPFKCKSGTVAPLGACVGVSAHPENGERVADIVDAASTALHRALQEGPGHVALSPEVVTEGRERVANAAEEAPPPEVSRLVDPLTGLLRPERVGTAVQKFVARYRRLEQGVSLLLMDVDHLQRYNEHYGKDSGDAILRGLGRLLQDAVREDDLVARLGDDEFLVVMGCSPAQALCAGQRLVSLVKRASFSAGASTLRITMSAGVSGYPDHGGHPRHLLENADAALNAARERGRNMCLVYEHGMRPPPAARRPVDVF